MTNVFSDEVDAILGTVPAFIFTGRADGYVDYVNRTWLDDLGLPFESVEGWQWTKFIHPDDREAHVQRWEMEYDLDAKMRTLRCDLKLRRGDVFKLSHSVVTSLVTCPGITRVKWG